MASPSSSAFGSRSPTGAASSLSTPLGPGGGETRRRSVHFDACPTTLVVQAPAVAPVAREEDEDQEQEEEEALRKQKEEEADYKFQVPSSERKRMCRAGCLLRGWCFFAWLK